MKKIISFALTLVIIFSFVGCGSMSEEINDGINSAPTQATTPKPTAIPTPGTLHAKLTNLAGTSKHQGWDLEGKSVPTGSEKCP